MASSLFSPPRNKPKISLSQPKLAAGQPMPQIQTINRPVNLVDDEGNVHGRIGENGQERVNITSSGLPTNDPAGGPNYASGGTLLIGGDAGGYGQKPVDPGQDVPGWGSMPPATAPQSSGEYPVPSWNSQPVQWNPWNQPVTQGSPAGNQQPANTAPPIQTKPSITSVPLQQYPDVNAGLLDAQTQQIAARNATLDQRAKTLDLKGAMQPQQQAVYDARGNVIQGQIQQNQMQKGYLQQVGQEDATKLAEAQAIYRASQNAPDLLNVANAQNAYSSENRRDAQMGVSAPAEVNLPPGYNGPRQAGVRPKIMSQEDRLKEKAGYEDPIRGQQLSIAKNIVDLQATDVQVAQLAAQKAGLTLDQANELVKRSQLDEEYAGLISSRRDVEAQEAGMAPFPGDERWTDPQTGAGRWVTPQEKDQLQAQYQQNVQQPYQSGLQNQGVLPQYQGLSIPQVLNTLPNDSTLGSPQAQPVLNALAQKLINEHHLSPEAARQTAYELLIQEMASRRRGTGTLALPGQGGTSNTTPTIPAPTGSPSPGSAPSGQTNGQPQVPPGFPGSPPLIPGGVETWTER